MDTLVTWCATAPQHKCVPLMMQTTAALAGMAMADEADAQLMVDRGILPVLVNMMEHGIGAPPPKPSAQELKLQEKAKKSSEKGRQSRARAGQQGPPDGGARVNGVGDSMEKRVWRGCHHSGGGAHTEPTHSGPGGGDRGDQAAVHAVPAGH